MTVDTGSTELSLTAAGRGAPPIVRRPGDEVAMTPRTSDDEPTVRARVSLADAFVLLACGAAALATDWLVYDELTDASGALGFVLLGYALFLAFTWAVVRETEGPVAARDHVATIVITTAALVLLVPLVLIIGYVVVKGVPALRLNFFTQDLREAGADAPLSSGGALQALVGTLEQVGLAVLLSVPLGVLTAVFLDEVDSPLQRPVRLFVDAMSGVPSIVAGLFLYAVVIRGLHQSFSGYAAGLALSVLMLPTVTRTSEEVLRLVPSGLREGALALGSSRWKTVWSVVLPTARSGLVTAVVLGIARAVGETAPLLLTAFGSTSLNLNPFSGAQDALPLFIYKNYSLPSKTLNERGYTAALVLIVLVLLLFTIARLVGSHGPGRRGPLSRAWTALRPSRGQLTDSSERSVP